ncbi:Endonuclease/exonuclease/phosphatase [Nannochloropsis gaditana]|uniref:Endonuclease/exonuclease/phosphatase n=1 Tax=Nannochloropsis gaditana TaxID=72520 RepID=W7T1Q3_9STRA|nr:Endonuclease/exonuclease/phosphatase [Nannochloropsis gaditana]
MHRLESCAYTIRTTAKRPGPQSLPPSTSAYRAASLSSLPPPPPSPPDALLERGGSRASVSTEEDLGSWTEESGGEEEEEGEETDWKVVRTPSYTDRVLTHSLPGQGGSLRLLHYDMCDAVELSDHRPVVATYTLQVDGQVRGFGREVPGEGGGEDGLAVFSFTVGRPRVEFFLPAVLLGEGEGGEMEGKEMHGKEGGRRPGGRTRLPSPHRVTFLFPLVPEDPVAEERLASALGDAFASGPFAGNPVWPFSSLFSTAAGRDRAGSEGSSGSGGAGVGDVPGRGGRRGRRMTASARRDVRWGKKGFPVRFETVASPRFSQHMLVKLADAKGRDLGEAVLPVSVAVAPEEEEEGHECPNGGRHLENLKAVRLPLTMGGTFQGWLRLELRVTLTPL